MTTSIEHLMELIDKYWDLAYTEGREGRMHDTLDEKAGTTRQEIEKELYELLHQVTGCKE
jgi:hypothetical protein